MGVPIRALAERACQGPSPLVDGSLLSNAYFLIRCGRQDITGSSIITVRIFARNGVPLLFGRIATNDNCLGQSVAREGHALDFLSRLRNSLPCGSVPQGKTVVKPPYISCWQTWIPGRRLDCVIHGGTCASELYRHTRSALCFAYHCHRIVPDSSCLPIVEPAFRMLEAPGLKGYDWIAPVIESRCYLAAQAGQMRQEQYQHCDLWPGNVLISDERAAVIDWELFGTCLLAGFDLFHFILGIALSAASSDPQNVTVSQLRTVLEGRGPAASAVRRLLREFAPQSGIGDGQWNGAFILYLLTAAHQCHVAAAAATLPAQSLNYLRLAAAMCRGDVRCSQL